MKDEPFTLKAYFNFLMKYGKNIGIDFLIQHGRFYNPKNHIVEPPGIPKECYRNAFLYMLDNPGMFYVEGFAMSIIPIEHAWCCDENGMVYDPTLANGKISEYLGVAYSKPFISRVVNDSKIYGFQMGMRTLYKVKENKRFKNGSWLVELPGKYFNDEN